MDDYASPQSVIKALKAADDPPVDGGPSKISIAQNAWKSSSVYFPNKDEVLAEWLLTTLVKERSKSGSILSSSHWLLLCDVLTANGTRPAPSSKAWLNPLLNRTPLGSLFTSFLDAFRSEHADIELLEQFAKPMCLLWPDASPRMNLDTQIECFAAVLSTTNLDLSFESATASLFSGAIRSYKQAYSNSTNKKKILNSFIEHHYALFAFHHAKRRSKVESLPRGKDVWSCLASEVHQAVVDVLFSAMSLKSTPDPFHQLLASEHLNSIAASPSILQTVPFLYRNYLQELRKHRNTVFGSGSNQTQDQTVQKKYRDAAFKSFTLAYQTISASGISTHVWTNALGLVEALEEANIVGNDLADQAFVLNDIVAAATKVAQTESDVEVVDAVMGTLRALCRIEFNIVIPHLPAVISALLTRTTSQHPASLNLLTELTSFYSKTRTLPSYLALLLDCLSNDDIVPSDDKKGPSLQELYSIYISSAVLSSTHLTAVARAAKTFLTPSQTPDLASLFSLSLDRAWMAYKESIDNEMDIDSEPMASRKKDESRQISIPIFAGDRRALAYSMIARLVATMLPSLPYTTLTTPVFSRVRDEVAQLRSGSLQQAVSVLEGHNAKSAGWAKQALSAAALRVSHALIMCRPLQCDDLSGRTLSLLQVEKFVRSKYAMPELVIELFRSFFDSMIVVASQEETHTMIDSLVHYVSSLLSQVSTPLKKSSKMSSLDLLVRGGHERSALIVWRLLLDRWLPLIDDAATEEQLKSLAQICLQLCVDENGPFPSPASTILGETLKSALFWELPRLRDAFISITTRKPDTPQSPATYAKHVEAVHSFLIRAPIEYVPRMARTCLVRKCMQEERHLTNLKPELSTEVEARTRAILRLWSCRVIDSVNFLDDSNSALQAKTGLSDTISYIEYLLQSPIHETDAILQATNGVMTELFRQIIRVAIQGREDPFQSLVDFLNLPSTNNLGVTHFINVLIADSPIRERFSDSCLFSLKQLHATLSMRSFRRLEEMTQSQGPFDSESPQLLAIWNSVLALGAWLGGRYDETPLLGQGLVKKLLFGSSNAMATHPRGKVRLGCEVLQLLLQELQCVKMEQREAHLALIASTYIILAQSETYDMYDAILSQSCRRFSAQEFRSLLEFSFDGISVSLDSDIRVQSAVHMSTTLLRHSPEGTMKINQDHFESCIRHFISHERSLRFNTRLAGEALQFTALICSEKPSSLRTSDVGSIWSLLAMMLSPSPRHVNETAPLILQTITSIAGSLIRLRRDLVTSTLPHFGFVLNALFRTLSAPCPQLGTRQFSQITNMLPWWVSTSAFLGIDEARAVARLMTTLQAKTIPRTFNSKDRGSGKDKTAVALTDAFSKHAGPVFGSYIHLLINPLISVSSGVRDALEPGVFVLCESMGEHGRDALMASGLDTNGRAVMKVIWRAYEKQRYSGKG